jgi:hypothetical protein
MSGLLGPPLWLKESKSSLKNSRNMADLSIEGIENLALCLIPV